MLCSAVLSANLVRFSIVVLNDAGLPADPTVVTCEVGLDAQAGTALTVVKDGDGVYHADWNTTGLAAGTYWVVAAGTGAVIASDEIRIKIRIPHLV